MNKNKNGMLL